MVQPHDGPLEGRSRNNEKLYDASNSSTWRLGRLGQAKLKAWTPLLSDLYQDLDH